MEALKVTLLEEEEERLAQPATVNVDAYNLYLLGRHFFHQRTEETLLQAKDYFQDAIEADPDYALAHTGLADTYMLLEDSPSTYGRQGWLSSDRQYLYVDDELDEFVFRMRTTTRIIDVSDLGNPFEAGTFTNNNTATDHNLYTVGNRL